VTMRVAAEPQPKGALIQRSPCAHDACAGTAARVHEPPRCGCSGGSDDVAALQGAIGNRATRKVLSGAGGRGPAASRLAVQTKLLVGAAGDRHEQEADRIAGEAARLIRLPAGAEEASGSAVRIGRAGSEVRRKPLAASIAPLSGAARRGAEAMPAGVWGREAIGPEGGAVDPVSDAAIHGARGGGRPLPNGVRAPLERAFGADFGGVRVHADEAGDSLSRTFEARAFTTGRDIFFRRGEYDPAGARGQELIAHELAHVVQQAGARTAVQRTLYKGTTRLSTFKYYQTLLLTHRGAIEALEEEKDQDVRGEDAFKALIKKKEAALADSKEDDGGGEKKGKGGKKRKPDDDAAVDDAATDDAAVASDDEGRKRKKKRKKSPAKKAKKDVERKEVVLLRPSRPKFRGKDVDEEAEDIVQPVGVLVAAEPVPYTLPSNLGKIVGALDEPEVTPKPPTALDLSESRLRTFARGAKKKKKDGGKEKKEDRDKKSDGAKKKGGGNALLKLGKEEGVALGGGNQGGIRPSEAGHTFDLPTTADYSRRRANQMLSQLGEVMLSAAGRNEQEPVEVQFGYGVLDNGSIEVLASTNNKKSQLWLQRALKDPFTYVAAEALSGTAEDVQRVALKILFPDEQAKARRAELDPDAKETAGIEADLDRAEEIREAFMAGKVRVVVNEYDRHAEQNLAEAAHQAGYKKFDAAGPKIRCEGCSSEMGSNLETESGVAIHGKFYLSQASDSRHRSTLRGIKAGEIKIATNRTERPRSPSPPRRFHKKKSGSDDELDDSET
jgi:Domain of unknown function (DUF4157)